MDETTKKMQDLHQLIYWIKETFKQINFFTDIDPKDELNSKTIDKLNNQLARLNLSLNFFKRFMVNFQIKYPNEVSIINLASKLAKSLDEVITHIKYLDKSAYHKALDKANPTKILLIMEIVDNKEYASIESVEKV
ncbi:hypothetical protein [Thorsellia kenyensis]|uniref:Uncharacterized protein n=1 Tax=Thorsellia kenyensis TaxID=1549888 RepID=A0ABV6C697_9GAMM